MAELKEVRRMVAERSPEHRSRVANGKTLLAEGDGRSAWARRYRDMVGEWIADLGGPDRISSMQLAILRRAAALMVEVEAMEATLANEDASAPRPDVEAMGRLSSHAARLLERVGVKKVEKTRDFLEVVAEVAKGQRAR